MSDLETTANYDVSQITGMLRPGMIFFSRYRVVKMLGRGGMGEVWLAEEFDGDIKVQDVVMKRVPPELQKDSDQLAKVQASFALVRKLRHPNICSALTFANDENYGAFCIMDYVPGKDLATLQRKQPNEKFTLEETVKILLPTAQALDYAHKKKILHRDIKPQNLMVPMDGETPLWEDIKIIDFDLAMEWHSTQSMDKDATFSISGTLPYMAPEQVDGLPQDGRTDQYSLGILAYQMLTGKMPFSATTASILIHQILNKEFPPIEELTEEQNSVFARVLAKTKEQRFDSCVDFIEALAGKNKETVLTDTKDEIYAPAETHVGLKRLRPEGFDPYYEWLGISPFLPLTYYTLLGLQNFEPRKDVISNAADRQMTFVRTYQIGKHSAESQRLLNEISKARVTLLNSESKAAYDAQLRSENNSQGKEIPSSVKLQQHLVEPMVQSSVPLPESAPAPGSVPFFPADGKVIEPMVQSSVPVPESEFGGALNFAPEVQKPAEKQDLNALLFEVSEPKSEGKAAATHARPEKAASSSRKTGKKPVSVSTLTKKPAKSAAKPTKKPLPLSWILGGSGAAALLLLLLLVAAGGGKKEERIIITKSDIQKPVKETKPVPETAEANPQPVEEIPQAPQYTDEETPTRSAGWIAGTKAGERVIWKNNRIPYAFRWVPAGKFMMGSPKDEPGRNDAQETQHEVQIKDGFWMLETEVTQEMYEDVMGTNPSSFKDGKQLPVDSVNWQNATDFCEKLSSALFVKVQLPTEAQWEYACRAGETGPAVHFERMWGKHNSDNHTHPVGKLDSNSWGLYDMQGNVREWCEDSWQIDPTAANTDDGMTKCIRGTSFAGSAEWDSRPAMRSNSLKFSTRDSFGFRVIITQ